MSKEHLEEIKGKNWRNLKASQVIDVGWLIEQAERAEELENDNFALMESLRFQDEELELENKHYRESIKEALNHIHAGNFNLATIALNKALLKE